MNLPKTADEWVVRKLTGALNAEEETAFQKWLSAAPSNAQEYEVAETLARVPRFLRYFSPDISVQAFNEALSPLPSDRNEPGAKSDSNPPKGDGVGGLFVPVLFVVGALAAMVCFLR